MPTDGLNEMEEAAAARRSRGARPPRNRRAKESSEEKAERLKAELEAKEAARRNREEADRRQREESEAAEEVERQAAEAARARAEAEEQERRRAGAEEGRKKAARPTSMPFYPDPDNEEFLWAVAEAATSRRVKVPATAVLRLALRRLEQDMTPSEIVRVLSGPVRTEGKMGRPRL